MENKEEHHGGEDAQHRVTALQKGNRFRPAGGHPEQRRNAQHSAGIANGPAKPREPLAQVLRQQVGQEGFINSDCREVEALRGDHRQRRPQQRGHGVPGQCRDRQHEAAGKNLEKPQPWRARGNRGRQQCGNAARKNAHGGESAPGGRRIGMVSKKAAEIQRRQHRRRKSNKDRARYIVAGPRQGLLRQPFLSHDSPVFHANCVPTVI